MLSKNSFVKMCLRLLVILIILSPLFVLADPGLAVLDNVENMTPAGGTITNIAVGSSLDIRVEVYKNGVTEAAGQGDEIACTLSLGTVPFFWEDWFDTISIPMSYEGDNGDNDVYKVSITPNAGLYEYDVYCTDTTDDTVYWKNPSDSNGMLSVKTGSGSCASSEQGDEDINGSGLGHNSFDLEYRDPFGAVPTNQGTVRINFRTCMDDVDEFPEIWIYNDRSNIGIWEMMEFAGHGSDPVLGDVTFWTWDVDTPAVPTIQNYLFKVIDSDGELFYRDDDPQFYGGGWGQAEINLGTAQENGFQITVYDENYLTAEWLRNAVIYQIFPDRFRNGNISNDPNTGDEWVYDETIDPITVRKLAWIEELCNPRVGSPSGCLDEFGNQFFGGDLQGVIDELDYLKALGVSAIYLNPIFQSPSNHLYDTTNYKLIDPNFGDLDIFEILVTEAKAHGIDIILDGVFNHTSSDSIYFDRYARWNSDGNPTIPGVNDRSGACESLDSVHRSWYFIPAEMDAGLPGNPLEDLCNSANSNDEPGHPSWNLDYSTWSGYGSLPKLDSEFEEVQGYFYVDGSNSVGPYWIDEGVVGWRLDAAGEIDPGTGSGDSIGYWSGFRSAVRNTNEKSVMIGEYWGDASSWLIGNQWDSAMNYRFRSAVLSWMFDGCTPSSNGCNLSGTEFEDNDSNNNSASGIISDLSADDFDHRLKSIQEDYPKTAWQAMMNLLGSHDTNRIIFLLKKISSDNAATALSKYKFLTLLQFTYPGVPTVYYGDEAGSAPDGYYDGVWEDDPYNRAPFPWEDEGRTLDHELQEHVRKLAVLRSLYEVLRTGDLTDSTRNNIDRTYAYARISGVSDIAVVLLNRDTTSTHSITMSGLDGSFDGYQLIDVMNCSGTPVNCPTYTISGGSVTVPDIQPLWGSILVEGALPPYKLDLMVGDNELPHNGSASVIADVINIGGEDVADGTQVDFTQISGGGNLSSASATTIDGRATVTYNAPGATTLAIFHASSGTYVGSENVSSVFVGTNASIARIETFATGIGPEVVDLPGLLSVKKTGLGKPVVTLSEFSDVPNADNNVSPYVDIHLTDAADVMTLIVTLQYTLEDSEDNHTLFWFGESGWQEVGPGPVAVDAIANTVQFTITETTSPNLSELTGTPFVVGGKGSTPSAVKVSQFKAQSRMQIWLIGFSVLLLLFVVISALSFHLKRKL